MKIKSILITVTLILLFNGCSVKKHECLRRKSTSDTFDKNIFEKFKIPYLEYNNFKYFTVKNSTLKGNPLFSVKDKSNILTIKPGLEGRYTLNSEISVRTPEKCKLIITVNNKTQLEQNIINGKNQKISLPLNLHKEDIIRCTLSGTGAGVLGHPLFTRNNSKTENCIFLICADTLRADHLQTYGYKRKTSPFLKKFSEDSVVFKNAYAQANYTLPSHMSLFTSLYEFNHGIKRGSNLSENINFFIENISTSFYTKSFNGGVYVGPGFGFCRGFDSYQASPVDQESPLASELLFNNAINDLKSKNKFKSLFYFLHTYHVHSPYNPKKSNLLKFSTNYKHKRLANPNVGSAHKDQYKRFDKEMIQNYIDLYDAEILEFDTQFKSFINTLKKLKLYNKSMIIIISDHGEEFFEHKGWGHCHSLYNELLRVPLIIKFPDNKYAGEKISTPAGLIDIMPFIMSYYNIKYNKKTIDGIDLMDMIRKKSKKRKLLASSTCSRYLQNFPMSATIIEGSRKTIYNLPESAKDPEFFTTPPPEIQLFEYYNLLTDPAELNNLYLKNMHYIRKFEELFKKIISTATLKFKMKSQDVKFSEEDKEKLKTLGYL